MEALTVLRVPRELPLDAPLPAEVEERAGVARGGASARRGPRRRRAGGRVRARSIGHAIVEEARRRDADLIVLGSSPRWRREARFFSPTVDYVLRQPTVRGPGRRVPRGGVRGVDSAP